MKLVQQSTTRKEARNTRDGEGQPLPHDIIGSPIFHSSSSHILMTAHALAPVRYVSEIAFLVVLRPERKHRCEVPQKPNHGIYLPSSAT